MFSKGFKKLIVRKESIYLIEDIPGARTLMEKLATAKDNDCFFITQEELDAYKKVKIILHKK